MSNPSAAEASLFRLVLSEPDIAIDDECIDPVTALPERPQNWVDTLSFGDGRPARAGDPRYDEVIKRYDLAAPARSHRLRIPAVAHNGRDMPRCDWRLSLHPPYFDRDMAFVVGNQRHARGEAAGGEFRLWIFRVRGNRWSAVGYGQGTYGRPVI